MLLQISAHDDKLLDFTLANTLKTTHKIMNLEGKSS